MHHSIERILSKPTDYKICWGCQSVNWYENVHCVNCEHTTFHEMHDATVKNMQETFQDDMEMELEV